MKITMKKSFAVIMALVMCVSVLFGMNLSAFAATNTIDYVYDSTGTYIYNWGTREQEATFLSQNATAFYSQKPIATLLALDGSSDINDVTSSDLYAELHSLMKGKLTKPTTYDATRDKFQYTDCQNSAKTSNKISSFYSGGLIGPDWDSGKTWNREHVWPNSKGEGKGEDDIMMLRPTAVKENGGRSNTAYGEGESYYDPNEESGGAHDLRGDVARIALYQYVCWGGDGNATIQSHLWGSSGVIESKKVLLKWMEEDPVDTWELGRNDAVEAITGTRNVFVDYPELAFDLFDVEIPKHQTPSGYANGNGTDDDVVIEEDETNDDTTTDSGAISGNYYEKVTTSLSDWSGDYLIVYEAGNKALNGGLSTLDAVNNTIDITISDGRIEANNQTTAAQFEIIKSGNKYTVKSASGLCIGQTSGKNALGTSSTYVNSLSISNGGAVITAESGYILAFNTASNQLRFRYYASNSSYPKAVLYKLVEGSSGGDEGDNTPDVPTNVFSAIANDDAYGTVTTNGDVVTVTPANGYKLSETEPYLVEGGDATVTDNKDGTYTISNVTGDVTISFNFEVAESGDQGTTGGTPVYQKITSTTDLTNGEYLIVYENGNVALNGSSSTLSSANTLSVTITSDNTIEANNDTNAAAVTIDVNAGTIKTKNGVYLGHTGSSNTLDTSSNASGFKNSFSINADGNAVIDASGNTSDSDLYVLRYNSSSKYFRYYKGTMQAVALYKLISASGGDTPVTPTYTVTANSNNTNYGTVSIDENNVITATPKTGYKVAGYTITEGTADVIFNETTNEFTVTPTSNVVIVIIFELIVEEPTGGHYVKVESNLTDWSGDYLIVYEDGNVAFNGALDSLKETLNNFPVVIDNKTIEATATRDAAKFTITKQADGTYTVKSASGYYIGHSATDPGLLSHETTTHKNTITFENGVAKILGASGFALQFNATSGTECFRYYNGTQKNIALYKYVETLNTGATITATVNDETMGSATVTGNVIFATANTGYEIVGYTVVSGSATVTREGGMFTVETSGEATIRINFAAAKNTVTFIERSTKSTITATTGTTITLPNGVGSASSNEMFDGWLIEGTEQKLAAGAQYTVTANVTFIAQFKAVESEGGEGGEAVDTDLTLTFDSNKANRTEFSTTKQVWAQNGITLTNNKGSGSNIADYGGPARFYANSEIIISCKNMVKIVFNANTTGYATAIKNSIAGATVNGKVVTIVFDNPCNEFTIAKLNAQARIDSIVVTTREIAATATPAGAITGAQVNVGADLSMNFYASLKNIAADATVLLRVTMGDDTVDIQREASKTIDGEFIFTVDGIAPQAMTDTIDATLILIADDDEVELDAIENYSVKQNATNLLAAYSNDANLKRFISDMLYYGAAAQKYTGYNTEDLATDNVTGLDAQSTTAPTTLRGKITTSTGDASFKSATVWFDVVNKLIVKFNNPEGSDIKVCIRDGEGNETELEARGTDGFITDGILASEFDKEFTFVLYEDDVEVQTLIYSVNAYASSKYDNSTGTMKDLALALYNYGISAKAYAESIA